MLSTETCSPVIRFRVCLDELLTSAHKMFADRSLVPLSLQLTGALEREFGLSVTAGSHDNHGIGHAAAAMSTFKASWRREVTQYALSTLIIVINLCGTYYLFWYQYTLIPHTPSTHQPTPYLSLVPCYCRGWILTAAIVKKCLSLPCVVPLWVPFSSVCRIWQLWVSWVSTQCKSCLAQMYILPWKAVASHPHNTPRLPPPYYLVWMVPLRLIDWHYSPPRHCSPKPSRRRHRDTQSSSKPPWPLTSPMAVRSRLTRKMWRCRRVSICWCVRRCLHVSLAP